MARHFYGEKEFRHTHIIMASTFGVCEFMTTINERRQPSMIRTVSAITLVGCVLQWWSNTSEIIQGVFVYYWRLY